MDFYLDAKSLYAATIAFAFGLPVKKSLLAHVQRSLISIQALGFLAWLDTRDMRADGLANGAVSGAALHEVMMGSLQLRRDACV